MRNTGVEYGSADRTPVVLPEMAELLPPLTGEQLAALEADGAEIMGIEHGTEVLPVIRGKEIADYRTSYTVMIVYEPSTPEPLR